MAKGALTIELDKKQLAAVNNWLSQMSNVDQGNTIQTALRQGAKVIQDAGKSNLAIRNKSVTGNLKKSFSIKVVKKKAYALSGFRRSAPKKGTKGGNHSYLVDRGTTKRYTTQGYYRGAAKGTLFWTDAVENNGGQALNTLMDAIYKSLSDITRRNQT